jgi:hypothetical protein
MDLRNTYIVSGLAMVELLQPSYVIGKTIGLPYASPQK